MNKPEISKPIKITFVCLGNICRSPLAHTIMEKEISERKTANQYLIDSSGLGSWHVGNSSDKRMIETAKQHGYNMTHRAQQFNLKDGETFDIIYAMDNSIYEGILQLLPLKNHHKVKLFRIYDQSGEKNVPDPYYDSKDGFEKVYQIVKDNCHLIIDNLLSIK